MIAYAALDPNALRQFSVEQLLITARWQDGRLADLHDLYRVVLHEMGHALGLRHSPDTGDIMYPRLGKSGPQALSARDRETLRLLYSRPSGRRIRGAKRVD